MNPFEGLQELMRWDPFRDLGMPFAQGGFFPDFDLKETGDAYVFKADLPGVKESDLEVSLTGNRLTISGKREEENRQESDRYFTYERSYGSFTRTFTLPGGLDEEHVQAELKDGVLSVMVPKAAGAQSRRIEIKARPKGKAEA